MNKFCLFALLLFPSLSMFSNPLYWSENASLYDHLTEVNKKWQQIAETEFLCQDYSFGSDRERIQMHLQLVENYLRKNPPANLNDSQVQNRNATLDILSIYWKAGNFPQNTFHKTRQPYFKDIYGTACAVGYLAFKTGEKTLVDQISETMNYAYVAELKDHYPELVEWAVEHGFTVEELAWIQPGYPALEQPWRVVGNGGGPNGNILAMKTSANGDILYLAGDFISIDGFDAAGIAAWDGTYWQNLGEGVTGRINAVDSDENGRVYIGGAFSINGQPDIQNLGYWNGSSWNGLAFDEFHGEVFTMKQYGSNVFIGGDFQIIHNGDSLQNLAFIDFENISATNFYGKLSTDGIIYSLDISPNHLLLAGGDFKQVATLAEDPIQMETDYLAHWDIFNENWVLSFEHDYEAVSAVKFFGDFLYTGHLEMEGFEEYLSIGKFTNTAGILVEEHPLSPMDYDEPGKVLGFVEHNDKLYGFGNITPGFGGIATFGVYALEQEYYWGGLGQGVTLNGIVRAAESYQDDLYIAGDFTEIEGNPFNGLAVSPFYGINPVHELSAQSSINLYYSQGEIHIDSKNLGMSLDLNIYNLNSQLIHSGIIQNGSDQLQIPVSNWAPGMYVYQLAGKGIRESGKLAVF